ncbi:MAG: hypothetical protein RL711_1449, partial [Bacteroidota bacterium]
MKKSLLTLLASALLGITVSQAQQLPNAQFNNWSFDTTKVLDDWRVNDAAGLTGTDSSARVTNVNVEKSNGIILGELDTDHDPVRGFGIPFTSTDSVSIVLNYKNNSANSVVMISFITADSLAIGGMGGLIPIALPNVGDVEFTRDTVFKFKAPVGTAQLLLAPFVESPFGENPTLGAFLEIEDIKLVAFKNGNTILPLPNGTFNNWSKKVTANLEEWKSNNGENDQVFLSVDTLGQDEYAVKLESKGDNNNVRGGELRLGDMNWNNNVTTVIPGAKLAKLPSKILLNYHYNTVGNDSAVVSIMLTKHRGDTTAIVGQSNAKLGKNNGFELVEIPVWMYKEETSADSIAIKITSSDYKSPSNTSVLLLDSIALGYPLVLSNNATAYATENRLISPNPSSGVLAIRSTLSGVSELTVRNLLGEVVFSNS